MGLIRLEQLFEEDYSSPTRARRPPPTRGVVHAGFPVIIFEEREEFSPTERFLTCW